jgi:hypothetical protein
MRLNRYQSLALAISALVVGRALVALLKMLVGVGE